MDISVRTAAGKNLKFKVPASPGGWKLIWKAVSRFVKEEDKQTIEAVTPLIDPLFDILKREVREHGSFDLVEVDTYKGDHVLIRM
ncbi:MAG: hypothetical protein IJI44_01045 [Erysipelotrichaceae bacterium]|nr:hypothetical protein [Erysipelotrichaceae bacterium]